MDAQGRVASAAPLRPGDPTTVGVYEIRGRLGEGGMGAVYLGRSPDGRDVAVKVVRAELADDAGFLARFRDEVVNAERVASFCTAQVLDHGEIDGRGYMVTEFIDGPSLSDYIKENGSLSRGMLHGVAVGVAAGLVAIHAAGLVHRDLKPRNVLLSMSGPRVIDFGIARALDVVSEHTKTGQLIGSPGWIAPELIENHEVTTAVDIWAWGCLIAYAATGRHPFGEGNFGIMAARVMHAQPTIDPLPAPLDGLVRASLDRNPRARPTAQSLLLTLIGGQAAQAGEAAVQTSLNETWSPPPPVEHPPAPPPGPPPVAPPPVPYDLDPAETVREMPPVETQPAAAPRERAANSPAPAAAPTQPPRVSPPSPPRTKRKRSPALVAAGAALAVAAVVGGGFALRSALDNSSGNSGAGGGPSAQAPVNAALPTAPLLVREDRSAGWPKQCHGSVAVVTPGSNAAPKRVLSDEQCDILPKWSPDRKRIAFTRLNGSSSELYVMNADGSGLQKVTEAAGTTRVAWSPDGKRLAYADSVGENREIFVITIGSSNPQQVTFSDSNEGGPDWARDGRLAFWSDRDGLQQIFYVDMDEFGKQWTKVTTAQYGADDPVWSPDSKRIAYTCLTKNRNNDIWVTNANGSNNHRLTTDSAHEMDPNWSPDGQWIVFARGAVATPRVWAIRADGTESRAVTPVSPAIGHPSWT